MSREKQIEEMARSLRHDGRDCESTSCLLCHNSKHCFERKLAEEVISKGYRKASDVAREIFEEIEEVLNMQAKIVCQTRETAREADEPVLSWIAMLDGRIYSLRVIEEHIAELKKKYIGEDTNVTTKESEKDNDT